MITDRLLVEVSEFVDSVVGLCVVALFKIYDELNSLFYQKRLVSYSKCAHLGQSNSVTLFRIKRMQLKPSRPTLPSTSMRMCLLHSLDTVHISVVETSLNDTTHLICRAVLTQSTLSLSTRPLHSSRANKKNRSTMPSRTPVTPLLMRREVLATYKSFQAVTLRVNEGGHRPCLLDSVRIFQNKVSSSTQC